VDVYLHVLYMIFECALAHGLLPVGRFSVNSQPGSQSCLLVFADGKICRLYHY
jgi:hypothetical protein